MPALSSPSPAHHKPFSPRLRDPYPSWFPTPLASWLLAIEPRDEASLSRLVSSIQISFATDSDESRIFCDGEDITHAIRSPEISRMASEISKSSIVREALVRRQGEMGKDGGVVGEGRDIGTVVFPDGDVKFYLDADRGERGRRRCREFPEKGVEVDFKKTLKEVVERDQNDMSRSLSQLKRAEDAIFIDSTCRSVEEVVSEMCRNATEKRRRSETACRMWSCSA